MEYNGIVEGCCWISASDNQGIRKGEGKEVGYSGGLVIGNSVWDEEWV